MFNILVTVFGLLSVCALDAPYWLVAIEAILLGLVIRVEYFKKMEQSKIDRFMWNLEDQKKKGRLRDLNPHKWGN